MAIVQDPARAVADILAVPEQRDTSGTVESIDGGVWSDIAIAQCIKVIIVNTCGAAAARSALYAPTMPVSVQSPF